MIQREDTLKQLALIEERGIQRLPESLQKNKLRADKSLFKEAQINYKNRRKQMMKQIIVDNVHYCTLKQIADLAITQPKETEKRARNTAIKLKAKKIIVEEQKAKYGEEKYEEMVEQKR